MWVPRLASLALMIASGVLAYTCYEHLGPVSDTAAFAFGFATFIGMLVGGVGVLFGLGGILLSYIVEPDGEGRFKYKQSEFTEILYPRHRRGYRDSYCSASTAIGMQLMGGISYIVLLIIMCRLGYDAVVNHYWLAMYIGGGVVTAVTVLLLCIWSRAFRIFIACFLSGSAVLGIAWCIHSIQWMSIGALTTQWVMTLLPWGMILAGMIALIFVIRFFVQTKAYRTICPISSNR